MCDYSNVKMTMDMLKRDRFELLSAYLDGEVSAAERRQVEEWLATDPGVQKLYLRLLNLRQGLRTMPVAAAQPAEQTVQQVFLRLDKRPKRIVSWGGAAIAAMFISALSGVIANRPLPVSQVAQAPHATLMVALNSPVIEIPKPPAAPAKSLNLTNSH